MSQVDVIRESIRYEQLLREGSANQSIKGEYLLRDSQYPDMKEVLGVDVKATITNKEVLGEKVIVEGSLDYIVFYLSKDESSLDSPANKIHAVVFNDKFSNYLDLNNDEHNIVCNVECDIEHIEANWMNERKVGINGLIILKWKIYKIGEFEYVKDIEGKEDDVYLSREEELAGINGDMISVLELMVADEQHAINLDDVGENRIVNVEFLVKGNVKVYSNEKVEILKDAYSPTMNIELENANKEFTLINYIENSEVMAKETFEIEDKEERVGEVIAVTGHPIIKDKIVEDERVKVEGLVKTNIIYRLAGEDLNYGILSGSIPFNTSIDIRGLRKDMSVIINPYLENIYTNIEGNAVSVRATVGLNIKAYYKINKNYIKDVNEGVGEVKEKKASVTIYVVGEGETLWDLAKKYNTTVSELEKLNDLNEEENIKPGCKLIIPGRAIF